jgi:hypothetical protein
MPKKNKSIRVKLIANPGAGDPSEAASRIKQVTSYLIGGRAKGGYSASQT